MSSQTLTVDVPPGEWLTANGRKHWHAKARATAALRHRAHTLARSRHLTPATGRVHVTATVQGRTQGRMDPANVYPTVKALIDGIVDASVLADDDDRHLEGPDMRRGTPDPAMPAGWHRITLTITNL